MERREPLLGRMVAVHSSFSGGWQRRVVLYSPVGHGVSESEFSDVMVGSWDGVGVHLIDVWYALRGMVR